VISYIYKFLASTRIAGGLLFRAYRPQLAKAIKAKKTPFRCLFLVAGAGLAPATPGLCHAVPAGTV